MKLAGYVYPEALFLSSQFALWGRCNDSSHRPIRSLLGVNIPNVLKTEIIDVEDSEIIDSITDNHWQDVRCIPSIDAPNANELIHGKLFHESFEKLVMSDPETRAAYEASPKVKGFYDIVWRRKMFAESPAIPLGAQSSRLALNCFNRLKSKYVETDEARSQLWGYSQILGKKTSRLLGLLEEGRVSATGFWRDDLRSRLPIDASIWVRPDLEISLNTSDVSFAESKNLEWRSVVVLAPEIEPIEINVKSKKQTKSNATAAFLKRKFPDGPSYTTKELHTIVEAEAGIGKIGLRTLETAIKFAYG
jgi:hypothetical protein